MTITDWFRTRRALIADLDSCRIVLADRDQEIETYVASMDRSESEIRDLKRGAAIAGDQVRHLTKERDDLRGQNIDVRNALRVLLGDIRREEQAERGVGILPTLVARNTPARRVRSEPMPSQLADAIAQETAMKRRLDGLGDE